MNEDQTKVKTIIQKSAKSAPVIEKAKPKDYLVSVSRIVLIVIVLIVATDAAGNVSKKRNLDFQIVRG